MTGPHPLDQATALDGDAASPHRTGHTSARYWTFISPFGGSSAATALRAVLERPERAGDPLAVTVNFCAPIEAGAFGVETRLVRANRSSQHWNVEFTQGSEGGVVLSASVVLAVRRETWSHRPEAAPDLPPASDLAPLPTERALAWVQQYEHRYVEGAFDPSSGPNDSPASARSRLWLRDLEPRPLDFVSLLAMSDAVPGRIFQVVNHMPPFGTVSMTTHFHASHDELAAHGTAPLAVLADARIFHRSYGDQTVELWSGDRLFATSTQVAYSGSDAMAEPAKPLLPPEVEAALARGDFIGAIKSLRGSTGIGLQDARAAIDRFRRRAPGAPPASASGMQQGLQHGAQGSKASASFANGALPPDVVESVHAGRTIEAIRLLREHSGLGLKEAKDAVDRYAEQRRAAFGPLSPGEVPRSGARIWMVVIVLALLWLAWRLLRSPG